MVNDGGLAFLGPVDSGGSGRCTLNGLAGAPRGLVSIGAVSFVMCVSSFGTGNDGPCVAEGWMRSANVSILAILKIEQIRTEQDSHRRHERSTNIQRHKKKNVYPLRGSLRDRGAGGPGGSVVRWTPHTTRGRARVAGRGARACSRRAGPASRERETQTETAESDRRAGHPCACRLGARGRGGSTCLRFARVASFDFSFALKSITARPPGNGHAKRHGTDRSGGSDSSRAGCIVYTGIRVRMILVPPGAR